MSIPMPRRRPIATRATAVLLAAAALGLAGCEKKAEVAAAPPAAKVNDDTISLPQIELVLQQQRLKPEQVDAVSRQVLQRLVDQQLAQQQALKLKLDQDPRVLQQLEAARREVLARAYFDKAGEAAAKPTAQDVAAYYQANPALFEQRRIYNLQEITIEARPEQIAALKAQLEQAKSVDALVEILKANGLRFSAAQALRSAEQLPIASLGAFAAMKDGQAVLNATPSGAQLIVLAGSRAQPVTLEQATPAIELFLLNARKRERIAQDLKGLREGARIEYVGKYADAASAPATGGAAASPSFAPAASDEASAAHK